LPVGQACYPTTKLEGFIDDHDERLRRIVELSHRDASTNSALLAHNKMLAMALLKWSCKSRDSPVRSGTLRQRHAPSSSPLRPSRHSHAPAAHHDGGGRHRHDQIHTRAAGLHLPTRLQAVLRAGGATEWRVCAAAVGGACLRSLYWCVELDRAVHVERGARPESRRRRMRLPKGAACSPTTSGTLVTRTS
jgi:hypothetical protein